MRQDAPQRKEGRMLYTLKVGGSPIDGPTDSLEEAQANLEIANQVYEGEAYIAEERELTI